MSGNHQKAISIAKPLAEAGQPWAQLRMGILYENGWGVEQNTKEAERWYLKAAAHKADDAWSKGQIAGATGKAGYFNQNSDALIAEYNLASLYLRATELKKTYQKHTHSSTMYCVKAMANHYFSVVSLTAVAISLKIHSKS